MRIIHEGIAKSEVRPILFYSRHLCPSTSKVVLDITIRFFLAGTAELVITVHLTTFICNDRSLRNPTVRFNMVWAFLAESDKYYNVISVPKASHSAVVPYWTSAVG